MSTYSVMVSKPKSIRGILEVKSERLNNYIEDCAKLGFNVLKVTKNNEVKSGN